MVNAETEFTVELSNEVDLDSTPGFVTYDEAMTYAKDNMMKGSWTAAKVIENVVLKTLTRKISVHTR